MNKILSVLGRVFLAQLFLLQVIALIYSFFNNPNGYLDYQMALSILPMSLLMVMVLSFFIDRKSVV